MRLGDDPELQKLSKDDDKCPRCGKRKKPEFALCYDCSQAARGGPPASSPTQGASTSANLPGELVFDTFYNDAGKLRQELFFERPRQAADLFRNAGLRPTALRSLYQGFLSFAAPLRDGRMDFPTARERYGVFHVERLVRQVQRGHLPVIVQQFMEHHEAVALSRREEMLGLFRYVTNILCYFGDKEEARGR